MRTAGVMDVLESVYRLEQGEKEWLGGIAESCRKMFADSVVGAVVASTGRAIPGDYELFERVWVDADDEVRQAVERLENSAPPWTRALMHRHTGAMTVSEWAASLEATELNRAVWSEAVYQLGIRDGVVILGTDVSGRTLLVNAALAEESTVHPRTRHVWNRVAVHLTAGLRLRCSLAQGEPMRVLDHAEAIFDPKGRLQHAAGHAANADSLELLREAARALDRARSRARDQGDEAVELWQGLFWGRWSLLDTFDSDGRRYVVALANDPDVAEDRSLTRRERQVVGMAALGQSDADIGYALGLGGGTVRTHLQRGMAKMGIASRRVLMQVALLLIGGNCEHDAVEAAKPFLPRSK